LRTNLILPHMFGLVSVSLPSKHVFIIFTLKKKLGENMQNFIFFFF
jgi:branched-subunit amino acid transport protein